MRDTAHKTRKILSAFAIGALCAITTPHVLSDDKAAPVDSFITSVSFSFMICQLRAETVLIQLSSGQPTDVQVIGNCISEQKNGIKAKFKPALAQLKSKKTAQPILKELYSSAISGMDVFYPVPGEPMFKYRERVKEKTQKINEIKTRLEIELDE